MNVKESLADLFVRLVVSRQE